MSEQRMSSLPMSLSIRFYVRNFSATLVLRGETGSELLERFSPALEQIETLGAAPSGPLSKKECPIHSGYRLTAVPNGKGKVVWGHELPKGGWCSWENTTNE